MSEEGDLLSQWRAYSDNGAGVSLGFNKEYFDELKDLKRGRNDEFGANIVKVEYNISEQKKIIAEHADKIFELAASGAFRRGSLAFPLSEEEEGDRRKKFSNLAIHFMFFFFHLYSLKNPAFSEEREWRLISLLIRGPSDDKLDKISKMEFRPLEDRIVPYNRIALEQLKHSAIAEVILGPRNITPHHIVEGALRKQGWTGVTVHQSRASYR